MAKVKLEISIQEELAQQLHQLVAQGNLSINQIVEIALIRYLAAHLEAEMAEGYRLMADRSRALAETNMAVGYEVLPDA
jgi:hypothetical protein